MQCEAFCWSLESQKKSKKSQKKVKKKEKKKEKVRKRPKRRKDWAFFNKVIEFSALKPTFLTFSSVLRSEVSSCIGTIVTVNVTVNLHLQ